MNDSGRVNVLYFVRTWAFGGSHTIVLHLLEHLPKERARKEIAAPRAENHEACEESRKA